MTAKKEKGVSRSCFRGTPFFVGSLVVELVGLVLRFAGQVEP